MPDFLFSPLVANGVGVLALTITVTAMARKSDRGLLAIIATGVAFWALHYGLMGSKSGAIVHAIAAVGIFCAHWTQNAPLGRRAVLATVFATLGVSGSAWFGTGLADVFSAVGCIVLTFSEHTLRGVPRRKGMILGQCIFLLYAIQLGSVPGMAVTSITALAGLVGLRRLALANASPA
ncbi:MAG: YgjV family protein [Oleiphilaceae bacterium]|nr:YgjV family protein [Oleiphilaceae bacterium]